MSPNESPSAAVSDCQQRRLGSDQFRNVVWVRGEHGLATREHLSVDISRAARVDDADIVVDLSEVTFMDASTIGALVVACHRLRAASRSMTVRAPSSRSRRLLDLCGLAQLIDDRPRPPNAAALGSWADVPARDRGSDPSHSPVADEAPTEEPARTTAPRRAESARAVRQRRASS